MLTLDAAGSAYRNPGPQEQPQARGGLVVAASLLDKAPNLAGLSRSAEAFGASKLLVSPQSSLRFPLIQGSSWKGTYKLPR